VRRGLSGLVACVLASLASATPCFAIETGQAPNLPPPPPPPLTGATPGTSAPPPAPRPARPASSPPPATVTASTTTASTADSSGASYTGHALDTRWFIAPLLGFASEDLNFGIGIRGGKTLDNHIYIGGTFVYQTGDSGSASGTVTGPTGTVTASASWSYNGFYIGPEGGYDFDLKYVVVRPYMGIGLFDITGSANGSGVSSSSSSTEFVVWPGCTVIWNIPDTNFFLGGDVRVITVPGGALGVYAMGGLHFGS
jgi:hypothetical protein